VKIVRVKKKPVHARFSRDFWAHDANLNKPFDAKLTGTGSEPKFAAIRTDIDVATSSNLETIFFFFFSRAISFESLEIECVHVLK
jgi:hypothetical protein